jgi:hypothetical protein
MASGAPSSPRIFAAKVGIRATREPLFLTHPKINLKTLSYFSAPKM